jgi:hypothetical protein
MQKIPLLKVSKHDEVVENLIHYLAQISDIRKDDNNKLKRLTYDLMNLWASKTSINRTAFEQHIYITKQLILAITYLSEFKNNKVPHTAKDELKKLLFQGIQNHLECPAKNMRCVGMITSEVIMGIFDGDTDNALKFDYEGFDAETMKMVNMLKDYPKRCRFVDDQTVDFKEPDDVGELIEEFFKQDQMVVPKNRIVPDCLGKS